jgi:hypothetical protein
MLGCPLCDSISIGLIFKQPTVPSPCKLVLNSISGKFR